MNTKFLSATIILLSALASIGNAYARGQTSPHQLALHRCNHAAMLAAEKLEAQFNKVDNNHDGSLEQNETVAFQIAARCFRHLDSNKDGKLSVVELQRMS